MLSSTNASTGMLDSISPRTPPSCSAICSLNDGKRLVGSGRRMQVLFLDDLLGEPVLHPVGRCGGVTGLAAGCHRGASSS